MNARVSASLLLAAVPVFVAAAVPQVTVGGAWSRPAAETGVVYANLRNRALRADALIGATSPVARTVELHQTMTMPATVQMGGRMMMQPRSSIAIPPHGSVRLEPGGYHLMLIGLRHPLHAGERIPVTLRFRNAGAVRVVSRVENRAF